MGRCEQLPFTGRVVAKAVEKRNKLHITTRDVEGASLNTAETKSRKLVRNTKALPKQASR